MTKLLKGMLAKTTLATALALGIGSVALERAHAQMAVVDPINYIPNYLTTLQTLESNVNEARMIAQTIQQYQNMLKNTESLSNGQWTDATRTLDELANVAQSGQAIAYSMKNMDSTFRSRFPGYKVLGADPQSSYEQWSTTSLDSIRGAMDAANLQSNDLHDEGSAIAQLKQQADGSQGQKAALDAANRIAIMQVQQQQKLRQLTMAQMQAQGGYMAAQAQKEATQDATDRSATRYVDPKVGVKTTPFDLKTPSQ
jgi:P-type conjugative transfer protein TrbJ